jgi:hemerythrin-like domain-containing protein
MAADLFHLIRSEHQADARLVDELESEARRSDEGDPARAQAVLATLEARLRRHFEAEERFFYPLLTRSGLGDHHDQARKLADEHEEAAGLLRDLARLPPSRGGFKEGVAAVASLLRHHWADEETRVFPHLRATVDAEELASAAQQWATHQGVSPWGQPETSSMP